MIRRELKADAETYGDPRRSPIVERRDAQALTEADLTPTEPITVVLSANGWVRAAKGHEVDPNRLSYKTGDSFLVDARGKSNQPAVFIDSTGRSYAVPAHSLPSARGQGEPMSGRLNLPQGAALITVLMGNPEQPLLVASDAGYGFVTVLEELLTKNRSGKVLLSLPKAALPLPPIPLNDPQTDQLVVITNQGRMLIFPLSQLPRMAKGKGNQIDRDPAGSAQNAGGISYYPDAAGQGGTSDGSCGQALPEFKTGQSVRFRGGKRAPGAEAAPGLSESRSGGSHRTAADVASLTKGTITRKICRCRQSSSRPCSFGSRSG